MHSLKFQELVLTNIVLTLVLLGFITSLIGIRPYIKVVTDEIKFTHVAKEYKSNFGTKNLPDAMEWHCSYFWGHALDKEMIDSSRQIIDLLNQYIALPISLKMPLSKYEDLANLIISI